MGKFIVRFLAVIGAGAILLFGLVFLLVLAMSSSKGSVPSKVVLEVNLETGLAEDVPDDTLARAMLGGPPVVRDVVEALERASNDNRVAGIVARVGAGGLGAAQVQEVAAAVRNFRSKKKFAVAWAETFGEFSGGAGGYHLATAFDQIWLQPSGDVGLNGIQLESMFVRGTLDKLGIVPRMDQRYEYKNAMNMYTEKKYTAAHKEAMERLMKSIWGQRLQAISEGRKIPLEQLRALVDRGPFLGKEALDAKLVDGLAYRDEVYDKVKTRAGAGSELLYLSKYLARAGRPHEKGKTIALVYGVGGVQRGRSSYDPIYGEATMGSDTVAGALRKAIDDKDVKAIVLRIDSPGGSYVASDTIWREVVRARKAGKPVIASMGNVAASGGYFVAMPADKIVAQPGTITGSIGVLGGKLVTTGLWDKVGVSYDSVSEGKNARMYSSVQDYSPTEYERFEASLDRIYADFTSKVAEGRRLPKERVLEIAKGRVWTGEDAKNLGLVDELGGFPTALALAKKAAKIPAGEEVNLKQYPPKKTTFQAIMDRLGGEEPDSSEKSAAEQALVRVFQLVQPVAKQIRATGVARGEVEAEVPEVR